MGLPWDARLCAKTLTKQWKKVFTCIPGLSSHQVQPNPRGACDCSSSKVLHCCINSKQFLPTWNLCSLYKKWCKNSPKKWCKKWSYRRKCQNNYVLQGIPRNSSHAKKKWHQNSSSPERIVPQIANWRTGKIVISCLTPIDAQSDNSLGTKISREAR